MGLGARSDVTRSGCGNLCRENSGAPGWFRSISPCSVAHLSLHVSGSLPIRDGGIPGWGAIDLQIDDHLLEFSAIGLAHLVLHERLRTLLPHLVVQNALWVTHILDQLSLDERLFLHDVCEDFLEFRSELPLRRLVHTKANNKGDLVRHVLLLE